MLRSFDKNHDLRCEICQQFFSVKKVAQMLDLSQKTVRRLINAGKIKPKRIGGSVRIAHSELVKIITDY